jgi:DNA-directed RNA polymerase subunit RPC12/RpoP
MQGKLFDDLPYYIPEWICRRCGRHVQYEVTGVIEHSGKPECRPGNLLYICSTCIKGEGEYNAKIRQERNKWG